MTFPQIIRILFYQGSNNIGYKIEKSAQMSNEKLGMSEMESDQQRIKELAAVSCLREIKGVGPIKSKRIFESAKSFYMFYNSCYKWFVCDNPQLACPIFLERIFPKIKYRKLFEKDFLEVAHRFNECENFILKQLLQADTLGGTLITFSDEVYPKNLYKSNQSIPLLYASGNINILKNEKACAVVGTRNPSEWTIVNTKLAVKKLVEQGYTIVSGLAKGIDTVAHRTALENNGKTIAVLGSGIDIYYPPENRQLQDEIKRDGVILSEYPFGMRVQSFSLKKRNKIIVGLSNFVLITETSAKGGTMNSYLAAVEQKKPVYLFTPKKTEKGSFDGNEKIENERKTQIVKLIGGDAINDL